MAIIIEMRKTNAYDRRKLLAMAARAKRRSQAMGKRAEEFELEVESLMTPAEIHAFIEWAGDELPPDVWPEKIDWHMNMVDRYRAGQRRLAETAERIERRARGIIEKKPHR